MNSQIILKKLEKAAAKRKADLISRGHDELAAKITPRTVSGLTYKVRSNCFSNSTGTCEFYPDRIYGHSYTWYDLVRKINGTVILNDYRYSQQTSQHIWKVSSVLKDLGIKFKTLEAPRGLQNLEVALKHELEKQANFLVREKYARKKSKQWVKQLIRESEKNVELLAELGFKATKKMRSQALLDAEALRRSRLDRQKKQRAEKKAMDALIIIPDFEGTMFEDAGYHVIQDRAWSWDDETGEYSGKISDYERRYAVSKGFTKIIVHRKERCHLRLIK